MLDMLQKQDDNVKRIMQAQKLILLIKINTKNEPKRKDQELKVKKRRL